MTTSTLLEVSQVGTPDCLHLNTEVRSRTIVGGTTQHVKQCLDCGERYGNPVKQVGTVPCFDEGLKEAMRSARALQKTELVADKKAQMTADYAAYRASPKWAAMRDRVLARDDHWCQGCLDAPADVVHHHTYAHVGNEFAFELVSLCSPCHTRIHKSEGSDVE
jgi:5-methylcytosine-specific restriction endonuclease McrA